MVESVSVLNLGPAAATARGACGLPATFGLGAAFGLAGVAFFFVAGFFAACLEGAGFLAVVFFAAFFLVSGFFSGALAAVSCANAGGATNASPQAAMSSAPSVRASRPRR